MNKTSLTLVTLFALSLLILSACASGGTASASPMGEWTLVSYGDASNPAPALSNVDTSLNFNEDGSFGGNVGCNSFGADYKVDGSHITFGSIVSTMMFCEETSAQESAVLSILTDKTLNYQFNGNQLTLTSQDGTLVVVLARK
ncbi:MAG: META domain-containing protein [Anaerolineales bacterium]|nr:META domain-containing protein [Anaerolineales bacterium]